MSVKRTGVRMSTNVDPETGYRARTKVGHDYGPGVRCDRCTGRGMCRYPGEHILCLRCADDWYESDILERHMPGILNKKKWESAYQEFLSTVPGRADAKG